MFLRRSVLMLCVAGQSIFAADVKNPCAKRLAMIAFQKTLRENFESYSGSKVSTRLGKEWEQMLPTPEKGHVLSFGSGPDIFRPLLDFPDALFFHLIDALNGWGNSPAALILELKRRVLSVHPDAELSLVSPGFVLRLPLGVRDAFFSIAKDNLQHGVEKTLVEKETFLDFWRGWEKSAAFREPLIFRIRWNSKEVGPQTKTVFLHPLDFNNAHQMAVFDRRMKEAPIAGVLVTGSMVPAAAAYYVDRLMSQGSFVVEYFSDAEGDTHELIRKFEDSSDFTIWRDEPTTWPRPEGVTPVQSTLIVFKRN